MLLTDLSNASSLCRCLMRQRLLFEAEPMRARAASLILGAGALLLAGAVKADEIVRYTYDAQGRLVRVERTGTVNNNSKAEYQLDKAGNRVRVKTVKP